MPLYEVETDDGRKFEVEADSPQLASQAVAGLNTPKVEPGLAGNQDSPEREAFSNLDAWDQARVGMAKPFVETGLGVQGMFADIGHQIGVEGVIDLTAEDRQNLETLEKGVHGWPALAGELTSDLAMFYGPGKFTKGKKLLDLAMTATMEGIKAPTEDTSRAERAAWAAGGWGIGDQLGKLGGRMLKGTKPSKAATEVTDFVGDLPLTPGQKGSGMVRSVEKGLAESPVTATKVGNLQSAAQEAWNKRLIEKAGSEIGAPEISGLSVSDAWKSLNKAVELRYDKAWESRFADPAELPTILSGLEKAKRKMGGFILGGVKDLPKKQREVTRVALTEAENALKAVHSNASQGGYLDMGALRTVDKNLTDAAYLAARKGRRAQADMLKEAKQLLRDQLSLERQGQLTAADKAYRTIKPLSEAQKKSTGDMLQPSKLATELRKGPTGNIIEGGNELYNQAEAAREVFEEVASKGVPNFSLSGLVGSVPAWIFQNEPVRKILAGTRPDSEKAAQIARLLADERFLQRATASAAANQ